jgi:endonuclease/exonuclease/phosphatase (EEP) superfamily protein YafD
MKFLFLVPMLWASIFVEVVDPSQIVQVWGQGQERRIARDRSYTLVNWNVYKAKMPGFHQDFHWLLSNHDLFTLQEFYLNGSQQSQIEEWLGLNWIFAKSFQDHMAWTGVVTLAPWEETDVIALKSPDREPLIGTPKVSLITKYRVQGGGELWVLNIHSLNFDITHNAFRRQLDELLDEVANYDGPLILAGDFNTWARWRRDYLMEQTRKMGLRRLPLESPAGVFNNTLDHIFYRGVQALEYEVLEMNTSDHKPLQMKFRMQDISA